MPVAGTGPGGESQCLSEKTQAEHIIILLLPVFNSQNVPERRAEERKV